MADLNNRADLELLVRAFYEKALADALLGPIFKTQIEDFWNQHLPKIYDFWESVLFHKAIYKGNPMLKHLHLHEKVGLTEAHFERWMLLWNNTVVEHFQGDRAQLAQEKARMLKDLMWYKIKRHSDPNFIQ